MVRRALGVSLRVAQSGGVVTVRQAVESLAGKVGFPALGVADAALTRADGAQLPVGVLTAREAVAAR